jgi:hypothetical protein
MGKKKLDKNEEFIYVEWATRRNVATIISIVFGLLSSLTNNGGISGIFMNPIGSLGFAIGSIAAFYLIFYYLIIRWVPMRVVYVIIGLFMAVLFLFFVSFLAGFIGAFPLSTVSTTEFEDSLEISALDSYADEEYGFIVHYPINWKKTSSLELDEAELVEFYLGEKERPSGRLTITAYDSTGENMSVESIKENYLSENFGEDMFGLEGMEEVQSIEVIEVKDIVVGDFPAVRTLIEFHMVEGIASHKIQYVHVPFNMIEGDIVVGEAVYMLMFDTRSEWFDDNINQIEYIVESFKVY